MTASLASLRAGLSRQMALNARLNLLADDASARLRFAPDFLRAAGEWDGQAPATLALLSREVADSVADQAQEINQYVHADAASRRALASIYEESGHLLRTASHRGRDPRELLRHTHLPRVGAWVSGLYPRRLREALASSPAVGVVPCHEYSAGLQAQVLRLQACDLRGPLLDVGCGREAALVRHLRAAGVDAWGCDRNAPEGPTFTRCDWFDYPFGPPAWQCITAHLSVGNHWEHAQLHARGQLPRWERLLRVMLGALRPGGALLVAPAPRGLLEAVPSGHPVRVWPVGTGRLAARITRPG